MDGTSIAARLTVHPRALIIDGNLESPLAALVAMQNGLG